MSSMERVEVSSIDENDIPWLTEISKRAYENEGYPEHNSQPDGYDKVKMHSRLQEYNEYYKITMNEYIVGGVVLSTQGEDQREILMMFIDPDYNHQGIGTQVIKIVTNLNPDVKYWTAGAPEWNEKANAFLHKQGFNFIGVCVDNRGQKVNWYHKTLNDTFPYIPIEGLEENMKNLNVKGKILEKAMARAVRSRRRGETLSVADAGLVDETGRIVLTLWNEQIKHVRVEDNVIIENGYVTSFRGVKQLNVGRNGRIIRLEKTG